MKLTPPRSFYPELWGGIECTVNRVGNRYFDQMAMSGHLERLDDLDRFAGLGLRALRYPVLWEHFDKASPLKLDWSFAERRLHRLRDLGVRPIVGLVHHGSGPPYTCLSEAAFADGLAAHAENVARRFPWLDSYTPVNEPLTTARFSGLYGHWFPHGRDDRTFARALIIQCRAVALSMTAVRRVNPAARLIQTDDLGKVFSTRPLAYQADFENERRWLTWDLLCGRVDPRHPLWPYLCRAGIREQELGWFADNPCPPDLVGINYYITSERFLDHRLRLYAADYHGTNGRHRYADIEAVRARPDGIAGLSALLLEAHRRYRLPLVVSEVHLGCAPEEQIRWFDEAWTAAWQARLGGIDVRAVTSWALLGSFEWDCLVTRTRGYYEPGAFDVRSSPPAPTPLAAVLTQLSEGCAADHWALQSPGWWRLSGRLIPSVACRAG